MPHGNQGLCRLLSLDPERISPTETIFTDRNNNEIPDNYDKPNDDDESYKPDEDSDYTSMKSDERDNDDDTSSSSEDVSSDDDDDEPHESDEGSDADDEDTNENMTTESEMEQDGKEGTEDKHDETDKCENLFVCRL